MRLEDVLEVSPCTESFSCWLVAPLSQASLKQWVNTSPCHSLFYINSEVGVWVVWNDRNMVESLIFSEANDDHEFQVRSRDKRSMLATISHNKDQFRHFASVASGQVPDNLRTGKAIESTRAMKSQETAREPANPSTGRNEQTARVPVPRTEKMSEDEEKEMISMLGTHVRTHTATGSLEVVGRARSWHGGQSGLTICELFSPARVTAKAGEFGIKITTPASFDISEGWNFFDVDDRVKFWQVLKEQQPDVVIMSPVCKAFSALMNLNWDNMTPEEAEKTQSEGLQMFQFCMSVAEYQISVGKFFLLEHPATASSWNTHAMKWLLQQEGVIRFLFDQCETGLAVEGIPNRKTTGIVTNHVGVATILSQYQCSGDHQHQHLVSGRPRLAQVYSPKLVSIILKGLQMTGAQKTFMSFPTDNVDLDVEEDPTLPVEGNLEEELDAEVEQEEAPRTPATGRLPLRSPGTPRLAMGGEATSEQKRKVMQNNMGHLSRDKMMALLKASGAKAEVMKYTQDEFECEACMRQKRPVPRRKAAFPRTFSFNRIVSVDYFFISFQGKTQAFLNIICHGTNYQQVAWLSEYTSGPPHSKLTWKLFFETWLQPFGLPETVTSDGGSEFRHHFERRLEQVGVLQIISDAASPWQCGRVERHGDWVKQRAEQELQSGQSVVQSPEDLSELIKQVVMNKNRFFHRGGYSPSQLVFGANPRVPMELLSDDPLVEIGLQEINADEEPRQ